MRLDKHELFQNKWATRQPGGRFNMNTSSYQYRKSHWWDGLTTVLSLWTFHIPKNTHAKQQQSTMDTDARNIPSFLSSVVSCELFWTVGVFFEVRQKNTFEQTVKSSVTWDAMWSPTRADLVMWAPSAISVPRNNSPYYVTVYILPHGGLPSIYEVKSRYTCASRLSSYRVWI